MHRRRLLGLLGTGGAGIAAGIAARPGRTTPLALAADEPLPDAPTFVPPVDTADLEAHVARRLTFGATPEVLAAVRELGWEAWVEAQLHPEELPTDPDLEAALAGLETLQLTPAELVARFAADRRRRRDAEAGGASREELRALREQEVRPGADLVVATVLRAVHAPAQLFELLVDHWSNHFSVHLATSPLVALGKSIEDRDVIRAGALGTFADLLVADAQSPAMLAYLDQATSRSDGGRRPNENYAREVLELHTLGVDGGYDEDDVLAMAHVLAGWTIDRRRGAFTFNGRLHEPGPRTVAGFTTAGRRSADEGEAVLRHLAAQPATARNVVTRLARRFVADRPSATLVDDVAATYLANGTALRPTLAHLLTHEEFAAAAGRKLKRPLELLASSLRGLGWPVPDLTDPRARRALGGLHRQLEGLGQVPFHWPAPNGYPDVAGAWRTTGALLARWNLAQALTGAWGHGLPLAHGAALDGERGPDDVEAIAARLHPDGAVGPADLALVAGAADGDPRLAAALLLDARPFQYR